MNKILRLRVENEMTQSDLARATGLSETSISFYENDKSVPSMLAAYKISKALSVSIEDLLDIPREPVG